MSKKTPRSRTTSTLSTTSSPMVKHRPAGVGAATDFWTLESMATAVTTYSRVRSALVVVDSRAAVLNLWAATHLWAADLCLVGRDHCWELRKNVCESHATIHEKIPSRSSGVRA